MNPEMTDRQQTADRTALTRTLIVCAVVAFVFCVVMSALLVVAAKGNTTERVRTKRFYALQNEGAIMPSSA